MTYASIFDDPAYYMTEAEYEAALAEWAAGPGSTRAMISPPEFLFRRPPMRSLPEPDPAPAPVWHLFIEPATASGTPARIGLLRTDGEDVQEAAYAPKPGEPMYDLLKLYLAENPE